MIEALAIPLMGLQQMWDGSSYRLAKEGSKLYHIFHPNTFGYAAAAGLGYWSLGLYGIPIGLLAFYSIVLGPSKFIKEYLDPDGWASWFMVVRYFFPVVVLSGPAYFLGANYDMLTLWVVLSIIAGLSYPTVSWFDKKYAQKYGVSYSDSHWHLTRIAEFCRGAFVVGPVGLL